MADDMEQRLMALINNGFERVLTRLDGLESDLRNLRDEHTHTREMLARMQVDLSTLPTALLTAMERTILTRIADTEVRLARLERKSG